MKSIILAGVLSAGLMSPACKKDNGDKKPAAETSVEILSASAWKVDTIGFDIDKNGVIDANVPGGLMACQLDDTFTFKSDSTGTYDEGALRCDDSDPQSTAFKWYLTSNDKVLNLSGDLPDELVGDFTITTLNDSSLVVYKLVTISSSAPTSVNLVIALKK